MPAYMLFLREGAVVDAAALATYSAANRRHAQTFVEEYGLKPLAVYGATEAFEGDAPDGIVLLEFPDAAAARAWYACPQYQVALPDRHRGAPYRAILLEGLAPKETTA